MQTQEDQRVNLKVKRIWTLLSKRDKHKIISITGVQVISGLLDLVGVVFIGVIGALAVGGFGVGQTGGRVEDLLNLLHLSNFSLQSQVAVLGVLATLVLVLKTFFSVYFTKRILNYLSHKGAELSSVAVQKTFQMSILQIQAKPQQEILFALTSGPSVLMVGILGTAITIMADASLMLVLGVTLLIVDPLVASFSILVFLGIGALLYRILHKQATFLGKKTTELNIQSGSQIIDVLLSYRFLSVRNGREYYAQEIGKLRSELGKISGQSAFMPYISKYVIETTLVVGSLLLAASQFLLQDATNAVATLSIFIAAGSRIAPAALRIQQGALVIKNNLGICEPALKFLEAFPEDSGEHSKKDNELPEFVHNGFDPVIKIRNISFKYPGTGSNALEDVSFDVAAGSVTSIVGASGSGKSTLADVLLGILEPHEGEILLSNKLVKEAIRIWPGATAYVPQEVALISGTIRENVAMGFASNSFSDEMVFEALELAQLKDFALSLPLGLDTLVGERGTRLSGGQKQRLGIARALFTKPKFILLDEATSSLDGTTEADISSAIHNLRGTVTVIMIAHRLSTVKSSDQLIYLAGGRLMSSGSFEKVRSEIPNFDSQALLMGL